MSLMTKYPFDDIPFPTEVAILRSSDGVDFKVYKNILVLASPFFRDMFSLPQSTENVSSTSSEVDAKSGTLLDPPVIDVAESSDTLDALLRLLYPLPPPIFPGTLPSGVVSDSKAFIKSVELVLAAALKYDMALVVRALCTKLTEAANKTLPDGSVADDTLALRVHALACRYGLKEEAYAAAHATLRGRVAGVFIDELRDMSAAHYFHLIQFHTKVVNAVKSIIRTSGLPRPYDDMIKCQACESTSSGGYPYSAKYECASWWSDFVGQAYPIFHESPRSTKVFSATFLKDMLAGAQACGEKSNHYGAAPSNCKDVHGKWQTMSQFIRDTIGSAITKNDINLSEL
ncbi:hypothetical protein M0805_008858 [Coniferiporia weirii]|nr:hypothetical protein M0805_008858 [Coniferiporia weirii]